MLVGLVGLLAAGAALGLYLGVERVGLGGLGLAALRAAAWGLVAALLVNPGCRRAGPAGTTVLLDHSLSMSDPAGDGRWRRAVDTARAIAGKSGRILLFGGEPAVFSDGAKPDAPASRLLPALREAAARGGPVAIVTDGALDDADALPSDLVRRARVVLLERPQAPDAGIAALDLPAALRAGDTATVLVDVIAANTRPADTVTVELREQGRRVAQARVAVGRGGSFRRELSFVPAPPAGDREARRYEAVVSGLSGDAEPRDDRRASLAAVTRGSTVVILSDSPDWDSRWLASTLAATSGVPVQFYVRVSGGTWRDARSLRPVSEAAVEGAAARATLAVAHGSEDGVAAEARLARHSLWRWPTALRSATVSVGDWYVMAPEFASPVGGALAGVAVESLPPLEAVPDLRADSVEWTGLTAQLDRRGRARPVVQGVAAGGRRAAVLSAVGLWRWASKGGVAREAYRALVAALTDWLLEERAPEQAGLIAARDSLSRGVAEFLPRGPVIRAQPGLAVRSAGEPAPLRHVGWVYWAALVALVGEWIARRRMGLR